VNDKLILVALALALGPLAAAKAADFAGLSRDAAGFAQVMAGKPLAFPRDFGAHPDFRIEWWYLTANLKDASGASYGAQWTLFRQGLAAGPERAGWSSLSLWMGHAAVTSATEHLYAETFARGGIGQAGVEIAPFRAFIDDWSLAAPSDAPETGLSRLRLSAKGADFAYALDVATDKPLVLHGVDGYSRKSELGQASYYFSQPFYRVEGTLSIRGRDVTVSGQAWLDREWSSQPLAKGQKGWDWFALHLASGENVMLYRFRSRDGRDFFAGTWIAPDGATQTLAAEDIALTPLSETLLDGKKLPTAWRVEVKSRAFSVETTPLNARAFMATRYSYWEGPISFHGSRDGEGYLEMTGY
jgi:predicted secreted hydrolase